MEVRPIEYRPRYCILSHDFNYYFNAHVGRLEYDPPDGERLPLSMDISNASRDINVGGSLLIDTL